ncbi:hypothetical protein [Neisseria sp. 74A18]|uniref:hypothetical protein n=1 Tax=Neisseria sp. 74A18 TaxID=1696094 RepID=UPI0012E20E5B|nr:hypothetical protein [Neisseria sp. 74A18]
MKEYQNAPTLCESIAIILVLILYYYFSMNGNIVFAHCGFLIFSVWTFFQKRKQIIFKVRRVVGFFICSAMSFFATKMFATWHFNNKYGIFKENLDFSVTAWAACIACTVLLCIPLFCQSIKFAWQAFHSGSIMLSFRYAIYSGSCLLLIVILGYAYRKVEQYDVWLLWLDAYRYSDCGMIQNGYAIRKNSEACYQFIFQSLFQTELREYPAPKP